ncbi:Uncharacterised protein [Vibrio cholerae]|nr:Uncharacterised protein [Vibrio cholerae]
MERRPHHPTLSIADKHDGHRLAVFQDRLTAIR